MNTHGKLNIFLRKKLIISIMKQPEKKHNERKAGRKPLPPEDKKWPVTVFLKQGEIDKLTESYGSVPLGVAYLLTL